MWCGILLGVSVCLEFGFGGLFGFFVVGFFLLFGLGFLCVI